MHQGFYFTFYLQLICNVYTMKTLILTPFILLSLAAGAQNLESALLLGLPLKENQVQYELVDSASATKEQLFTAFQAALIQLYKYPSATAQLEDKAAGVISGKSNFLFSFHIPIKDGTGRAWFTYLLQAKEGKYRITLTDWRGAIYKDSYEGQPLLEVYNTGGIMNNKKYRERYLTGFHAQAQEVLAAFHTAIKKSLAATSQEW